MAPKPQLSRPISGLSMRREAWDDIVSRQEIRPTPPVGKVKPSQNIGRRNPVTLAKTYHTPTSGGTYSAVSYPGRVQLAMICIGLLLGNFLVALDTSIITGAIPTIATDFQSMDDVSWYGSVYLLTLAVFQPLYGKIFRLFNKKLAYLIAIIIFEIGSLVCAVAQCSPVLIIGRAIAGIGAAGILQGGLSTINLSVPPEMRTSYTSLILSVFWISACFGPILGGILTDKLSWRWCFWINLPVGGVSVISNIFFFQRQRDVPGHEKLSLSKKLKQLDLASIILIAAFVCLVLALQWAGTIEEWRSPTTTGLLFGSFVLVVVFAVTQWHLGEYAIIPPRIFFQRTVFGEAWYFFFMQAVVVTHAYFLPFYFQLVQGVSATQSGIRNVSYPLLTIFGVLISAAFVRKVGYHLPSIGLGAIIASVGSGMITTLGTRSTMFHWVGYQALAGFGAGLGLQLPFSAIPVVLNDHDALTGHIIINFIGLLGGALALPITQTVFINTFTSELPKYTGKVDPWVIVRVGATNLHDLVDGADLEILLRAYSTALQRAFIIPAVAAALAFAFGLAMEWESANKVRVLEGTEDAVTEGAV